MLRKLFNSTSSIYLADEKAKDKPAFERKVVTLKIKDEELVKEFSRYYLSRYQEGTKLGVTFNRRACKFLLMNVGVHNHPSFKTRHTKIAVEDKPDYSQIVVQGAFFNKSKDSYLIIKPEEVRANQLRISAKVQR